MHAHKYVPDEVYLCSSLVCSGPIPSCHAAWSLSGHHLRCPPPLFPELHQLPSRTALLHLARALVRNVFLTVTAHQLFFCFTFVCFSQVAQGLANRHRHAIVSTAASTSHTTIAGCTTSNPTDRATDSNCARLRSLEEDPPRSNASMSSGPASSTPAPRRRSILRYTATGTRPASPTLVSPLCTRKLPLSIVTLPPFLLTPRTDTSSMNRPAELDLQLHLRVDQHDVTVVVGCNRRSTIRASTRR